MGWMDIEEILQDLQSVKLRKSLRGYVDGARKHFQQYGDLPIEKKLELRRIYSRYNRQIKELHASRERAKHTNGLRKMGLTKVEAQKLVEQRKAERLKVENEFGF